MPTSRALCAHFSVGLDLSEGGKTSFRGAGTFATRSLVADGQERRGELAPLALNALTNRIRWMHVSMTIELNPQFLAYATLHAKLCCLFVFWPPVHAARQGRARVYNPIPSWLPGLMLAVALVPPRRACCPVAGSERPGRTTPAPPVRLS